ncbi:MAG TPA: hypothetical protein VL486_13765 [Verrucomicrobiae bacterium]|nr:hypothetical protein [Verrucomicrobiae bacterium]
MTGCYPNRGGQREYISWRRWGWTGDDNFGRVNVAVAETLAK